MHDASDGDDAPGSDSDAHTDPDPPVGPDGTPEGAPVGAQARVETRSDRRRRGVRQLLFVIAGSHTGAFLGSSLPTNFGLPGNVSGALLVVVLFVLPFVVDAKWERIEAAAARLGL